MWGHNYVFDKRLTALRDFLQLSIFPSLQNKVYVCKHCGKVKNV